MRNYIFDVDGTLTPSRLPIDKKFEEFFLKWMEGKNVYLVTGSDKDKTIEQVGEKIWNKATRCYQSCGNAVYEKGKLIRENKFKLEPELQFVLVESLVKTKWGQRYGNHIEERIGLINFSTIGRQCPQDARIAYDLWDQKYGERKKICDRINREFPKLQATIGGQISIDIHPKGQDKSQILNDVEGEIMFFGDRCEPGGNDYPIVEKIKDTHIVHKVRDWKSTMSILENI
jgi:phosphomannomutase